MVQAHTLSGIRWKSMVARCKEGGYIQTLQPNYLGCVNRFRDFQDFVEWSRGEIGYDLRESVRNKSWAYPLDKDLISGRVYSPETCLYIPKRVNSFICGRATSDKYTLPMGTYVDINRGGYRAQTIFNGKTKDFGRFEDPFEAHRAWQLGKISNGRVLAGQYKNFHLKLYSSLNLWLDRIQEDYDRGKESFKGGNLWV